MKKALKHTKVYIFAAILFSLGIIVPFGILAITLIPSLNTAPFQYQYLLWIFAAIYFLVGYLWCDLQVAHWRKVNQEWSGPADPLVLEKGWIARWSFWFPAMAIFLVCLVFEIIALVNGGYPFL